MPDCFFRRGVADAASTYELGSSPNPPALPGDLMFSSSRWMIAFMSGGFRFNELWTLLNWGPVAALPACLPASPLRSALLCSLQSRIKQLTQNTLDYLSLPIHSGPIVVIRIAAVDPLTHTHTDPDVHAQAYTYIYICTRTPLWLSCTYIPAGRADARQRSLWSQLIGNRSRPSVRAREKNLIMRPDPRLIPRNGVRLLSLCGRLAFVTGAGVMAARWADLQDQSRCWPVCK